MANLQICYIFQQSLLIIFHVDLTLFPFTHCIVYPFFIYTTDAKQMHCCICSLSCLHLDIIAYLRVFITKFASCWFVHNYLSLNSIMLSWLQCLEKDLQHTLLMLPTDLENSRSWVCTTLYIPCCNIALCLSTFSFSFQLW